MNKLAILSLLILPLAACMNLGASTQVVNFYVLASPPETVRPASNLKGPYVGVMPVNLPAYLQRPQLVLRAGNNVDISIEDYHRWGEDLALGIARVVSQGMTNELTSIGGSASPLRAGNPVDLRIRLDMHRFDGAPDEQVTLEALWILQRDGKNIKDGSYSASIIAGPEITDLVLAQSEMLYKLSEELSNAVRSAW